jgi:hypothetical protein
MSRRWSWAAAGLLIAAAVWPGAASSAAAPFRLRPAWNVILRVQAEGDYRSESSLARTDGSFTLEIEWTGTLEKDDQDFLLVHSGSVLKAWRIEERTSEGDVIRILSERDAPDKPELKVNYALNDAGRVRFDFTVAGIDVPLAGSTESFPLVLPVSAESGSKAGTVAYNAAVKSGSNDVAVDAARFAAGPVEETFAWTWRRQAWVQLSDSLVFQSNGHKAKVTLILIPWQNP